jgi:hypothetical protein
LTVNDLASAGLKRLGTAKASIGSGTVSVTNFDFGTPDDLNLSALTGYGHADRVLVVFTATATSGSDSVSFDVQDADDNAGAIGTPAAAVTDGTLTGLPVDAVAHTFVRLQYGRPWLRCRVTKAGTTSTVVATAQVFAVGPAV